MSARKPVISATSRSRGFLPPSDPPFAFPDHSELAKLDSIGRELPSLLEDPNFRTYAREQSIPPWPTEQLTNESLPLLRLYYVRLGFLASAYVNQVGQPPATVLPQNIAVPLVQACRLLRRPPILSYDGYALYNWRRLDSAGPIALGNIDTFQNFVHLYDEHWFILVHVEIEALAASILSALGQIKTALGQQDEARLNSALAIVAATVWQQVQVLRRIPERMDPSLYYTTFRPYIRFFENVVYEGVDQRPLNFRGETGAQSSIIPTLVALMKIDHKPSLLTDHLADMRRFMPAEHRAVIEDVQAMPPVKPLADKAIFNDVLEAMATFREVHYGWAQQYIERHVADPRGTGGTPYAQWLKQLIDETRAAKIA
jgi:indoleamine 2,3-dioxygenase